MVKHREKGQLWYVMESSRILSVSILEIKIRYQLFNNLCARWQEIKGFEKSDFHEVISINLQF